MDVNNQHVSQHMTLAAALLLIALNALSQMMTTVAGDGAPGFDGARVNNPYGLAIGPDGALYFCDIDNHAIRKLDLKTGRMETVVAGLGQPYELVFDRAGNLFFVDMPRHVVQKYDMKSRRLTTIAGTGEAGFSGDGGPAVQAMLKNPHSIALDRDGRLLICDIGNHRVRRIDLATGLIETWLGTGERKPTPGGALAREAPVNGPRAIAIDADGTAWLVLREGNAVYRIDAKTGRIYHVAGTGEKGYTGDGGPAVRATFNGPKGIAVSRKRELFLADTENHVIRRIDLKTGIVTTVASGGLKRPHGVFVERDGSVYVGDSEAHRIRKVTLR